MSIRSLPRYLETEEEEAYMMPGAGDLAGLGPAPPPPSTGGAAGGQPAAAAAAAAAAEKAMLQSKVTRVDSYEYGAGGLHVIPMYLCYW
jgi:hypothetical protein